MRNILKSLFIVLSCFIATSVWADATLFTADFSTWPAKNYTSATFENGVYFSPKNNKVIVIDNSGLNFNGQNASSNRTHVVGIPVTGVNGSITVTISHDYNPTSSYKFKAAITEGSDYATASPNMADAFSKKLVETYENLTGSDYIIWLGEAGSSYKSIKTVTITTPGQAGPVAVESVTVNPATLTIEAGQTSQLTATVLPSNAANQNVSWSSSNTNVATVDQNGLVSAVSAGTANITVTTEDGGKTSTCAVTVTAPVAPIPVTAISLDATATVGIGATKTLTVTYTPADANTGKAVTWSSANTSIATVDANGVVTGVAAGTVAITATSTTDPSITASCNVTVQAIAVTGVSVAPTSLSIKEGATSSLTATVQPTDATNRNVTWSSNNPAVATVNANGVVTGVAVGSTTITVTTEDGNKTATCAVTVTEATPVPPTDLTIHMPEVYEAPTAMGGYNGTLSIVDGREYEVYYSSYDNKDSLSVVVTPARKTDGITYNPNKQKLACKANDGWFEMSTSESKSDFSMPAIEEFNSGSTAVHKLKNGSGYEFHIQGFDLFSFYGKENSGSGKNFEVYVDDILQTMTKNTSASIRRFSITTGEHVIKVKGIGSSNEEFYAFSLRVAQEPRAKWVDGNDSTQVVLISDEMDPVLYYTKYNSMGETRLEWDGPEATGITLSTLNSDELGDTLVLSGTANCAAGEYSYRVVSYANGRPTRSIPGKLRVVSGIHLYSGSDLMVDAYQGEEMDQIKFRYYALSADDVQLTWTNGYPAGVGGSGNNGIYTIGGTPTTTGTFPYEITVIGADTVIKGKVEVLPLDLGNNPVLYLFKNKKAYKEDVVYKYLTTGTNKRNLIARKTKDDGLRPSDQYQNYKWILISEDVDANNAEVMAVIHGGAGLPVLNMKAFSYAHPTDSLKDIYGDPWGEPDNGTLTENGRKITVERDDHPIFQALGWHRGDEKQILDTLDKKGLMPIAVKKQGSLCLATAWTRNITDYYADGDPETFLHEIPAADRGGKKYICMPIACSSINKLTSDGEKLIDKVIDYLLNDQATVTRPSLQINGFSLDGAAGEINQNANTIHVVIQTEEHPDLDLASVQPKITLASEYAHSKPANGEYADFSYATFTPVMVEVSDYINRRVYAVTVELHSKSQGMKEVYSAGEWVNIYDIQGRKVATTNEDIYTMALPRGIYIVVTESGQTIKLMR